MTDEVVTRLYRALVEELDREGHPEDRPVKVSELYQKLVPYRSVRSRLGVELNADYEHALLRLLAGERDLLRLEPAQAREELRREVDAPYPFVGLFRKFSASNVWVNMPAERPRQPVEEARSAQDEVGNVGSAPAVEVAAEEPATADPEPTRVAAKASPPERRPNEGRSGQGQAADGDRVTLRSGGGADPAPTPVRLHSEPESDPSERLTHNAGDCAFCGEGLPAGRRIRFCPHCGGDQRLHPCPRCDAVLERDWRYCISCGHETA